MRFSGYLKYMTWQRLRNLIRANTNILLSRFGIYRLNHMPEFASIEPANYCMLHCPQCPVGINGNKSPKLLSTDLFNRILDNISPYIHTLIFYFQGEPLLNNQLPEMVAAASAKKIYTMLSTNGLLMTDRLATDLVRSGLSRIIISIDGVSQAAYGKYRTGGSVEKAVASVRMLNQARQKLKSHTPLIEVQCLRLKSNEKEWDEMQKLYRLWGADRLVFKTAQFYDYESGNELMPTNNRYSRYRKTRSGIYIRKKPYRKYCRRLWSGVVFDVNGNVLPCCFDKDRKYVFGNIQEQDFKTIWQSAEAVAFREKLLNARQEIDICQNCTE